jgi:CRP-like cAMP-binding protein
MRSKPPRTFNAQAFLESAGVAKKVVTYRRAETIFSQGDVCDSVMYVQRGGVKLTVHSKTGKEVVVAMLGPGDFFGEGSLAGQQRRMGNATALTLSAILVLKKERMIRLLHEQPDLADRFIAHMLGTNIRIEGDLLAQLFNHDEKRLARALLLLARYGMNDGPAKVLPKISHQKLAQMSGTTRSNVAFFMNKFRRLGFIDDVGGLTINNSLLSVVLHE